MPLSLLTIKNLSALLLVGIMLFPVGIDSSFAQTLNKVVVSGAAPTAPTAGDLTIEVLIDTADAKVITLPFNTLVSDTDAFTDLTITFSIPDDDDNALFNTYIGTDVIGVDALGASDVATVTAAESEPVTITSGVPDGHTDNVIINYNVLSTSTLSSSGVITLKFTNTVGDVTANPHTITLDNLFGLPVIATEITNSEIRDLLSASQLGDQVLTALTLTIGASDQAVPGTLTFTPLSVTSGTTVNAMLTYTPNPGFAGTETFAYTIEIDGKSATSQIIFIVPALVCDTSPDMGAEFGTVDPGEESIESPVTITNSGNSNVQVMMSGAQWLSVADNTKAVMNVDVTKWSLTADESYAAKTGLVTTGGADIPTIDSALGADPLNVYLQLAITLLDQTFRGATTQALTVSTTCE